MKNLNLNQKKKIIIFYLSIILAAICLAAVVFIALFLRKITPVPRVTLGVMAPIYKIDQDKIDQYHRRHPDMQVKDAGWN